MLQCLAPIEVLDSGSKPGFPNSLIFVSGGGTAERFIRLRGPDRKPFLRLDVSLEYAIVASSNDQGRSGFRPQITRYFYGVQDISGRELFAYHWHPVGASPVTTLHMHMSGIPAITIATDERHANSVELPFNRIHFPTHRIELAELVRFLIVELNVSPRRQDWESVVNRSG